MRNIWAGSFIFLLLISACGNVEVPRFPRYDHLPDSARVRTLIVVSVGPDDAVSVGKETIAGTDLDSLLYRKIDSLDPLKTQPFVVINADSASSYGVVYRITQISKRAGARVTTNIKTRD